MLGRRWRWWWLVAVVVVVEGEVGAGLLGAQPIGGRAAIWRRKDFS